MTPLFHISELSMMQRLGIGDRDDMRSMRQELLVEGIDWEKIGTRILLTEASFEKLAASLKLFPLHVAAIQTAQATAGYVVPPNLEKTPPGPFAEADQLLKSAPPVNGNEVVISRLVVLPVRVVNPHILVCCPVDKLATDRTAWVNVRVKNAANFKPSPAETGEILARHIEGQLWEFAGNPNSIKNDVPRCPRWPGRW